MTITQLTRRCKEVALQNWNMEYNLPVEISNKMSSKLGYYQHHRNEKVGIKIVFSHLLFQNYKPETIESVIQHELTHWAFHMQGKPFKDKHPVFEAELRRVGGSSTRTITKAGKLHKIVCCQCEKEVAVASERVIRNLLKQVHYTSTTCCGARYKYSGTVMVEDTYERRS